MSDNDDDFMCDDDEDYGLVRIATFHSIRICIYGIPQHPASSAWFSLCDFNFRNTRRIATQNRT